MSKNSIFNFALSAILIIFSTCSDEDPKIEPIQSIDTLTYFTIHVEQPYDYQGIPNWIIISDSIGIPIDYVNLADITEYEFKRVSTLIEDEIGVHLIRGDYDGSIVSISSYLNVSKNSVWYLSSQNIYTPSNIGSAQVNISNFPIDGAGNSINVGTNSIEDYAIERFNKIDADNSDFYLDEIQYTMLLVKENDELIIGNTYKDNDPRYLFIPDVSPDNTFSFDFFEDFVPYENIVLYQHPTDAPIWSFVYGKRENSELQVMSLRSPRKSNNQNFTQFGYIPGYQYYATTVMLKESNTYTYYSKIGKNATLKDINLPEFKIEMTESNYSDFAFIHSVELNRYIATYSKNQVQGALEIKINGLLNGSKMKNLNFIPIEIIENGNSFFNKLNLTSLRVFHDYGDLNPVLEKFKLNSRWQPYEHTSYQIDF